MATRRRNTTDDEIDRMQDAPEMRGLPTTNRRADELSAAMQARVKGKPRYAPPPELNPKYRPYWIELVNSFPVDHFQDADLPLLKLYCRCAFDVDRLTEMIEEEGEVVLGAKGPIINPRVRVRNSAENQLLAISTKFRAQPASRGHADNYRGRQGKATAGNNGAKTVADSNGLLAGYMVQ